MQWKHCLILTKWQPSSHPHLHTALCWNTLILPLKERKVLLLIHTQGLYYVSFSASACMYSKECWIDIRQDNFTFFSDMNENGLSLCDCSFSTCPCPVSSPPFYSVRWLQLLHCCIRRSILMSLRAFKYRFMLTYCDLAIE